MSDKKKQVTATPKKKEDLPAVKFSFDGNNAQVPDGEKRTDWALKLYATFGSSDVNALDLFVNQIMDIVASDGQNRTKALNGMTPLLRAINPTNELESMLAVQMIGIHTMSMEMMKRAMISDQTVEGVNFNVNRATKLSRTFITQMQALDKHRGKGQQKILVKHVSVHQGGQAIVGNVEQGGRDENKK